MANGGGGGGDSGSGSDGTSGRGLGAGAGAKFGFGDWGRRWSLRTRFVLVALACLLPLLGVALFVLYQSLNHGRAQLLESQATTAQTVAQAVSASVGGHREMLQDLANQPAIWRPDADRGLSKPETVLNSTAAARGGGLLDIFLIDQNGSIAAESGVLESGRLPPALQGVIDSPLGRGEFDISPPVDIPNVGRAVALVHPVSAETGTEPPPFSAVGALLATDQLRDTVLPFARRGETVIGVVAGQEILATRAGDDELSDEDVRGRLQEPIAAAVAGQSGTVAYEDDTGVERLAAYAPVDVPGSEWAVFVSRPSPTEAGPSRALVERGLAAVGLAVVATIFLAVVLSEWIARPLRQLTGQAVAIARGDFGQRAPSAGGGEVAALGVAFGEMADQLATQLRDLEAAREAGAAQAVQLRDLLRRTVRLQEDERRRIAGEIHDAVNPLITGALYQARALRLAGANAASAADGNGANATGADARAADLDAIADLLTRAMEELHGVIFDLRPPDLDDLGVVAAIERYVAQIARAGLDARLEVAGGAPPLTPEVRLAVYRIVQEALHNALRHAAADEAVVGLETGDGRLRVTIRDNGAGFDPHHPTRPAALGLLGMRERAAAIGASFAVASRPGDGTTVVIERPLEGVAPAVERADADELEALATIPVEAPAGQPPVAASARPLPAPAEREAPPSSSPSPVKVAS